MDRHTDELEKLERITEVYAAPRNFESPAKEFVPGPYYAAVEEVLPELANIPKEVAGDVKDPKDEGFPVDRRDFMRLFSASAVLGAAACVRRPEQRVVPYVNQPIDHVPGTPVSYASTCGECPSACGVTVKTREGRPVKLEGTAKHPVSQGGLCSMGQASIQGLYHPERRKGPMIRYGARLDQSEWDTVYSKIAEVVGETSKIGILTGGSTGFRHAFYAEVLQRLGSSAEHLYTWEANSLYSNMVKAHQLAFGVDGIPRVELKKTQMIVGVGTDFMISGTSPLFLSKTFAKAFSYADGKKSKFVQFESDFSNTGTMADERFVIPPGYELTVAMLIVKALYKNAKAKGDGAAKEQIRSLLEKYGSQLEQGYQKVGLDEQHFDKLAAELLTKSGLMISGSGANFDEDGTMLQLATIFANILTGAYGGALIQDRGWMNSPVRAGDMQRFAQNASKLDVLFIIDTDPVFEIPRSFGIRELLSGIRTVVSIQPFPNDCDQFAKYILPAHHYLEAWGDEQPFAGLWSLRQPAVRAATDSRQAEDMLLWILAHVNKSLPYQDYYSYLKKRYESIHKLSGVDTDFERFFKAVLRRGFIAKLGARNIENLRNVHEFFHYTKPEDGLTLITPLDSRLGAGRGAHLPILQEVPDGLTTITWDSWLGLNPETAIRLGLKKNQVAWVESKAGKFKVAVCPLPGLHPNACVVTRGNGHENSESVISKGAGVDPLVAISKREDPLSAQPVTSKEIVKITPTNEWFRLAMLQKHNDIANREDIVKKMSLAHATSTLRQTQNLDEVPDIFPKLEVAEHRWGMSIDLNKCNGCGACMVACSLENNIPQVGREQVILGREMHWIRLDRYFFGDINNPEVTFQPVMCQHCNHAPCEAVCPVFATTHDPEGLNAMTYNRCVGTRYCANACPYKVRRFNWWTHKWGAMDARLQDRTPRALNPDVTVRTRGVMEKCSFCVGRLRDAKHAAKEEGRKVYDGEVQTACEQTCPTEAITFGNLNQPASRVSRERSSMRSYLLLGGDPQHGHFGLKTLPNVNYLAEVKFELREEGHHGASHGSKSH